MLRSMGTGGGVEGQLAKDVPRGSSSQLLFVPKTGLVADIGVGLEG